MGMKVVAIVPAAGLGTRFSSSVRKSLAKVADTPLLAFTLKKLHEAASLTEIIPVMRQEDIEKGFEMVRKHQLDKVKRIAPGGKERQDSVYSALKMIKEDCLVLVHDGVRPVIPAGIVESLMKGIEGVDGVIPGIPVNDTLKEVDENNIAVTTVNRGKYWSIQTPQLFTLSVLRKAYDRAFEDGFYATDDAGLVERIGGKIRIIPGSRLNIKVTSPEDLDIVEHLLKKNRKKVRVRGPV